MSDDLERVAERLRIWRDDAGFSLQALATRSGVAASTIQKIERQQMVPTIAVLLKIAHGLGRRPSEFLDEHCDHIDVVHLRASDRQPRPDGQGGTIDRLAADVIDPSFEVYRVEQAPGESTEQIPIHLDGEQLISGLEGELTVMIAGTRYRIQPGDCLHWKARSPYSWSNEGTEPARFLVAGTLPQDIRSVLGFNTRGSAGPEGDGSGA